MCTSNPRPGLRLRVERAAEDALSRQQYVSAIDVLCGMGLLAKGLDHAAARHQDAGIIDRILSTRQEPKHQ